MFMKIWKIVLVAEKETSNITVKQFKDIPSDNLLPIFVKFISKEIKLNKLAKKLVEHWNETKGKECAFSFRFRGEESRNYLAGFPKIILMLFEKIPSEYRKRLMVIFAQSLYLRPLISYTVRVIDITLENITHMEIVAKKLYKLCCNNESSITAS